VRVCLYACLREREREKLSVCEHGLTAETNKTAIFYWLSLWDNSCFSLHVWLFLSLVINPSDPLLSAGSKLYFSLQTTISNNVAFSVFLVEKTETFDYWHK